MTRVIVHAGYHKTGTTSLQSFLNDNKDILAPYMRYFGKMDFMDAGSAARIYAQRPFPWRLAKFRKSFRTFLNTLAPGGTILLSRETFSGSMPGHRRIGGAVMTSYFGPALKLARVIISELYRHFGKDTEIIFFYTTREREAWIKSVHGHLLRSIRMREDFATFRARFPALASPAEEAKRMAGALHPVSVETAALETYGDRREGPAAAILDFIDVPQEIRTKLTPAKQENRGQHAKTQQEFWEQNQGKTSRADLKAAKQQILKRDSK